MRKLLTVLASAAVVVGLGAPVWANGKAQSADQPITAMGKGGGHHGDHRDHDGRRSHGDHRGHRDRDHDGYRHHRGDYDRGYYRHHRNYDRYYYGGYYGCGYYPDCDPYYGGYYGGRRDYYDRDYDRGCGYNRPRYDSRCDCYHRDTRCDRSRDRYYDRGCGCYRTNAADEPQPDANAPAAEPAPSAEPAPAAESPSPQQPY
jgi:hypothetical protein